MKFFTFFAACLITASLLATVSCHKSNSAPTISIDAPLADDQFTSGQIITIKGEATDGNSIHALTIKITDDKTGTVLFMQSPSANDQKNCPFNLTWTAKVSDWTDATVTIMAENQETQQTIRTVKIKIWL
jgi:hypothetical protein